MPFSSRSEFQSHYSILSMNVSHASIKLNDLQLFFFGSCTKSHWEGGFWIRCPCPVKYLKRNQSLPVPSCVKTHSCFQFPSKWWTFDSFYTQKNPNIGGFCGTLKPAELLICTLALAFTANVIPPSLVII